MANTNTRTATRTNSRTNSRTAVTNDQSKTVTVEILDRLGSRTKSNGKESTQFLGYIQELDCETAVTFTSDGSKSEPQIGQKYQAYARVYTGNDGNQYPSFELGGQIVGTISREDLISKINSL